VDELRPEQLVPHAGRALFLERVVSVDELALTAQVRVHAESPYAGADGVGAWIGVEYMAQAAAALAGYRALKTGSRAGTGLLLAARKYECDRPRFPLGATLLVRASGDMPGPDGAATFECTIAGEEVRANGTLLVIARDGSSPDWPSAP
jgi:predicted hotdog family 3-hydroxylacyl-ACP dehydratase